jgi:hypothetical protein
MNLRIKIALTLIVSVSFAVNAQIDQNVAMVSDFEGTGSIKVAGNKEPADILIELATGAQISLAEGSKLSLFFFESSEEYAYEGPVEILIEAQQPKLLSGNAADTRNLNMAKLAGIAADDEDGIGLGVLKLRNFEKPKLQLLSPVDTTVVAMHPKFSWLPVEGATTYEFSLSNELGKQIASAAVTDHSIELPDGTQLISGAEYTWEITTQIPDAQEYSAHAYFTVAEQEVMDQVEASRPAPTASFSEKVVYARLLEKLGSKQDAKTIWQELDALKPNSPLIQSRIE